MDSVNTIIAPELRGYGHCEDGDLAIVERLIDRCIKAGLSCWVEDSIGKDEDWQEAYSDATSGMAPVEYIQPDGKLWTGLLHQLEDLAGHGETPEEDEAIQDAIDDAPGVEVMQWFLVESMDAQGLREAGEVVLESPHGDLFWGRQGCGQAISLDATFWTVAANMEILKGQRYSW